MEIGYQIKVRLDLVNGHLLIILVLMGTYLLILSPKLSYRSDTV